MLLPLSLSVTLLRRAATQQRLAPWSQLPPRIIRAEPVSTSPRGSIRKPEG